MKWLITGGCGFLGVALIKQLLRNDEHKIRVVDSLAIGTRSDLAKVYEYKELRRSQLGEGPRSLELVVGDILDESLALEVSKDCDIIVHLAANTGVGPSVDNPRLDCVTNVLGTLNYLEAARLNNISRFIFASSGAPTGEVEPPIHEELPPHPVSPYGASKLAGEGYCSAYNKTFNIDTVALRFGNVYGPGSAHKNSVVAKFIRQFLKGEKIEIYGDGNQSRDFIYIDDLIDAILICATTPGIGGETFQIASGGEITVKELSEKLIKIMRRHGISDFRLSNTDSRIGDVKRNFADNSKARKRLGWAPKFSINKGLSRTVKYFLEDIPK